MSKEQTPIEKAYDLWLCGHPKRDYSYKTWTHRARAIEFSQFYTNAKVLEALEEERKKHPFSCWYCNATLKKK